MGASVIIVIKDINAIEPTIILGKSTLTGSRQIIKIKNVKLRKQSEICENKNSLIANFLISIKTLFIKIIPLKTNGIVYDKAQNSLGKVAKL